MFERYTESARRVLFFARYEVSQLGELETEHLLLGVIRESQGLVARILALAQVSLEDIRRDVEARCVSREKIDTSIEIPFSAETRKVLGSAAEEADRLGHNYIGTEHLLLGLLREESSVAGSILTGRGLRADDVRQTLVKLLADAPAPETSLVRSDVAEQIDHIKRLVEQLAGMAPDSSETHVLAHRLRDSLDGLKRHLGEGAPTWPAFSEGFGAERLDSDTGEFNDAHDRRNPLPRRKGDPD
jgi:ATP-dependent Clp protease ATP-binding subunit ClpA